MKKVAIVYVMLFFEVINAFGQFNVAYFPDSMLSEIKIDGDTTDWNWFPKKYLIANDVMIYNHKVTMKTSNSFKCEIKVAWNKIENKIYILAKIFDDTIISHNTAFYNNDCMEFLIDPLNTNGKYNKSSMIRGYLFGNNFTKFGIRDGPAWMKKENTNYVGYHTKCLKNNIGYIMIYEMSMGLWDKWYDSGPIYSKRSDLYIGKTIKMGLIFDDNDNGKQRLNWSVLSGKNALRTANEIPQFILQPPITNGISWENINLLLKQY